MGGVKKVINKALGNDKKPAAQNVLENATSRTQAVEQGNFEESEDRKRRKGVSRGKKRLQIPTTTTATNTAGGGTGLGTGA